MCSVSRLAVGTGRRSRALCLYRFSSMLMTNRFALSHSVRCSLSLFLSFFSMFSAYDCRITLANQLKSSVIIIRYKERILNQISDSDCFNIVINCLHSFRDSFFFVRMMCVLCVRGWKTGYLDRRQHKHHKTQQCNPKQERTSFQQEEVILKRASAFVVWMSFGCERSDADWQPHLILISHFTN